MTMEENIGNIKSIEIAYERTQEYIVYDSFKTVMIAIVLFLVFMKLFDEYQKNITNNNNTFDLGSYWGHIRIYIIVCVISTSAGTIFNLVENVFGELQTNLINGFGGDLSDKAFQSMRDLVHKQVLATQAAQGQHMEIFVEQGFFELLGTTLTATLMSIGVFIYKYTYTFFILGRYMWLLMLELIAPVAIMLVIHENTRSYFYTWLKNMLICYMLIPMFLLAEKFSNEVANFFMEGIKGIEATGDIAVCMVICVGVWVKIKMFVVVRTKSSQLF